MRERFLISEIFSSVQGEGCNIGRAATFIRLAGCNLDCSWCDQKDSDARVYHLRVDEIVECIQNPFVVITGGEPTLQDISRLAREIKASFSAPIEVAIETNGTKFIDRAFIDWIAVSPKAGAKYKIAEGLVYDELKYVVDLELKPEYIVATDKPVWLQPQWYDRKGSVDKAKLLLKYGPINWRLGIQAHKFWEVE